MSDKKHVKLHPEFGLNPTMPVCFWCSEETGEIVLLGNAFKGRAPRSMILSYDLCPKCEKSINGQIHVIEVVPQPITKHQRELAPGLGLYPSGNWCAIKRDALNRIFPEQYAELRDRVLATGKMICTHETYSRLTEDAPVSDTLRSMEPQGHA